MKCGGSDFNEGTEITRSYPISYRNSLIDNLELMTISVNTIFDVIPSTTPSSILNTPTEPATEKSRLLHLICIK
jgi:hypothetical protein